MSGIYIHVPYCRQACHYCDFHFSTNLRNKTEMVEAIVLELDQRKDYFKDTNVETIYFGGGTPSLLSENELNLILEALHKHYKVDSKAEITVECNPEDLSKSKLLYYRTTGINRLSIGIQTFNDNILKFLNRVHTAAQACESVLVAKEYGFNNLTIDLMYALPGSDNEILRQDLEKAILLDVPHISAYCFTLEEKTVFGKMVKQKKLLENEDSAEQQQYEILHNCLIANNYEQYEISNYARDARYSKHNSAYWFGIPYLGIGPGAHSFNGSERQWNISNNSAYIRKLNSKETVFEVETLTADNRFNEGILTRLRTKWGVDSLTLKNLSSIDLFDLKQQEIAALSLSGMVMQRGNYLFLTEKGKLLADGIAVKLMI